MTNESDTRDELARERTHLANERTFLAYIRTALAMIAAGAGMLQFFDSSASTIAGWILVLAGCLVIPLGIWRFIQVRRQVGDSRTGR